MLNRSSLVPNPRNPGTFWQALAAMKPAAPVERPAPRRRPGRRLGEEAGGVLLLAAILVAVCAYMLLMDRFGVSLAVVADMLLAD